MHDQRNNGELASWGEMVEGLKARMDLAEPKELLLAEARGKAAKGVMRRVYSMAELGQHRTHLNQAYLDNHPDEDRAESAKQLLAMSDFGQCWNLTEELPLLASAYQISGDPLFLERTLGQLEEMTTWSPLQRPFAGNWGVYDVWLATGLGARAIYDTLEILPPESVSPKLRAGLLAVLEKEIPRVVNDWKTQRSWWVSELYPHSNQWACPLEGLVRACLLCGRESFREEYELGVRHLLTTLDACGVEGEFSEGFHYGGFTVNCLLRTAHAMSLHGDDRLISHPFLGNFTKWYVGHIQPGRRSINCFNSGPAAIPRRCERIRNGQEINASESNSAHEVLTMLSAFAALTKDPTARWALDRLFDEPLPDLAGLIFLTLPPVGDEAAPPLFAHYKKATRVQWRDSWADDATGLWIRGGHAQDTHDHADRGHVSFTHRGRLLLIDSGTPNYENPLARLYQSGAAHNVLQLGTEPVPSAPISSPVALPGWQKAGGRPTVPLAVKRLDAKGGEVTLNATGRYDNLKKWERTVSWNDDHLSVTDEVLVPETRPQVVLFRWHLGTDGALKITGEGRRWTVAWADATIGLEGSEAITVSVEQMPDNTILDRTYAEAVHDHLHPCIVVQSSQPVAALKLTMSLCPAQAEVSVRKAAKARTQDLELQVK
ncbi:MAG: heparinase II/III family protein [Verrucomicrobia bacterium]|nr:heparinase II/III family protein [Verrucomicrobiota bacterium]